MASGTAIVTVNLCNGWLCCTVKAKRVAIVLASSISHNRMGRDDRDDKIRNVIPRLGYLATAASPAAPTELSYSWRNRNSIINNDVSIVYFYDATLAKTLSQKTVQVATSRCTASPTTGSASGEPAPTIN